MIVRLLPFTIFDVQENASVTAEEVVWRFAVGPPTSMFPFDLESHVVLNKLHFFALMPGLKRVQPLLVIGSVIVWNSIALVEVLLPQFQSLFLVLIQCVFGHSSSPATTSS